MLLADPFYYLNNFQSMIDVLVARDGDLLDSEERAFIGGFASLPQRARALLVRMVMRKGALFRESRLRYPEIDATATAMEPLLEERWVDARPALHLDDIFKLLTKTEVALHLRLPRAEAANSKSVLLESLRTRYVDARPLDEWCEDCGDTVYKLVIDSLCERLRLMFFGNFRQDWSEFVLKDLGVFKFETIEWRHDSRPFASRRQVEDFHRLYRCRQMLNEGLDPKAVDAALPPRIEDCEWLEERRQKLRFRLGRAYERAGAIDEAVGVYTDCVHPEAAVRLRCIERRCRRGGGSMRRPPAHVPTFELALPRPQTPTSVERLVAEHLTATAGESTFIHFVENGLINSLFGLLCWTAIFAPIPGAFFHAYHHGPADLTSSNFAQRRAAQFADCFALLRSDAYRETIRRHFLEKTGIASPFVAWGWLDPTLLETALQCFPAAHIAAWCEWIASDVCANRTGFPDLVQFWPESRRYRLVEVKGPGDRLQDNQRRCLEFCLSRSIPVSVCRVSFQES